MVCPICQKENRATANFCSGCGSSLHRLDLCFVMDATGSMRKYIDATRDALTTFAGRLANQILKPEIRYGLVVYRDYSTSGDSDVTRGYNFSDNLNAFKEILGGVKAKGGGGDGAEAVADGLYDALYSMTWGEHTHKVLLLVGDAPPHGFGHARDKYPNPNACPCGREHGSATILAKEAHRQQGITIFCLGIGNDAVMQRSFAQIAECGGGQYVPVDSVVSLMDSMLEILLAELQA